MIGDLFYRFGYVLGQLGQTGNHVGKPGAAAPGNGPGNGSDSGSDSGSEPADAADSEDDTGRMERAVVGAAAAWLAARLLRPRPVSWPRVVVAGVAATLLADLVGRMQGDGGRGTGSPPHAADAAELTARLGAGVAIAAGYASLIYPRIPGPPLLRGLAFGALEIAAAPRGGLVRMAGEMPGLRFPLKALATPIDEDAAPVSHLAFGVGLGLFYRYASARHEEGPDEIEAEEGDE